MRHQLTLPPLRLAASALRKESVKSLCATPFTLRGKSLYSGLGGALDSTSSFPCSSSPCSAASDFRPESVAQDCVSECDRDMKTRLGLPSEPLGSRLPPTLPSPISSSLPWPLSSSGPTSSSRFSLNDISMDQDERFGPCDRAIDLRILLEAPPGSPSPNLPVQAVSSVAFRWCSAIIGQAVDPRRLLVYRWGPGKRLERWQRPVQLVQECPVVLGRVPGRSLAGRAELGPERDGDLCTSNRIVSFKPSEPPSRTQDLRGRDPPGPSCPGRPPRGSRWPGSWRRGSPARSCSAIWATGTGSCCRP